MGFGHGMFFYFHTIVQFKQQLFFLEVDWERWGELQSINGYYLDVNIRAYHPWLYNSYVAEYPEMKPLSLNNYFMVSSGLESL